jgi:hypothetical protein
MKIRLEAEQRLYAGLQRRDNVSAEAPDVAARDAVLA